MSLIRAIGSLVQGVFKPADVQYPLPTNGDQVYVKDVNPTYSTLSAGWSGSINDLFDNVRSQLINSTSNNPKTIYIEFERAVLTSILGGGNRGTGDFSNMKVTGEVVDGTELVLLDDSADATKVERFIIKDIPVVSFIALKLEFFTADTISISALAIAKTLQVTSGIQGRDSEGIKRDVVVTKDGNLAISDNSSGLAIAEGLVTGKTYIHKFGAAPLFDIAPGIVDIWDGSDKNDIAQYNYVYSTSNAIDSISSANNADTQDIEIQGLYDDGAGNWLEHTQTITLTGQTRKALDQALIRVFRMKNVDSTETTGYVYCYENTTLTAGVPVDTTLVRAVMRINAQQTLMALYTIPSGIPPAVKTGYMRDWYAALAGAKRDSVNVVGLYARPFGQVFQLKHLSSLNATGSSYIQHKYIEPERFEAKTDLVMRTNTDENDATVAAGFDIVLVEN